MRETILVLCNSFNGLVSFRKEVMQALLDKGYEVVISGPDDSSRQSVEDMGCTTIVTEHTRKGMNPISDLSLLKTYRRLIKAYKPRIVLSYTIKPNLYGGMACAISKVPQIANITGLGTAVENPGILQKITIMLYRLGLRKTSMVFFQNEANRQFCLKHKMVSGPYQVIPGSGVNLSWHSFMPYPEDGTIRFLYLGRLLKEKGFELYINAAEAIKSSFPNTEFHIVGSGDEQYRQRLNDQQKSGTVIYHGRQSDVRDYIAMANCTIHPSFYPEGMSNVLLESCAAGRPIITTDRPGCGEIVDDGVNGFCVAQRSLEDLVSKIRCFIELPYERKVEMGLAARRKVEREFDRQIVVDAYMNEIENLSSHV